MSSFTNLHAVVAEAALTVANVSELPSPAVAGDMRYVEDVASLYMYDGSSWSAVSGVGAPGSTTDTAIARWDGTGGSALKNSGVLIDDTNNITGAASLSLDGFTGSWVGSPTLAVGGNVEAEAAEFVVQAVADPATAPHATFYLESSNTDAFSEFGHNLGATSSQVYGVAYYDNARKSLLTLDADSTSSSIELESSILRVKGPNAGTLTLEWEAAAGTRSVTSPHTANRTNTIPDADGSFLVHNAASTDNAIARWDGTSGAVVQNSSVTINDSGVIAGASIDADSNTITNIENADIKVGAAIDAAKIHDGSVSNTEFGYLANVTSDIQTQLNNRELSANKGVAGGYASLDGGGKIPVGQLPSAIMTYEGTWSAATNTPTLADGVGDAGSVYIVSAAGTVDFGSGNITFAVGDWVIYNGTVWQQSDNADDVVSVNGFTGTVVLDYNHVNAIEEMGTVANHRLIKTQGTTGDQVEQSGVTVDNSNHMSGVARLDVDNVRVDGNTVEATTGNLTVTAVGDVILDAAGDSVQVDNAGSLMLRGTGGSPVGLTFYDGDESNYIQVQIPTVVTSNRTPQIPDASGDFVLTTAAQAVTNKTQLTVNSSAQDAPGLIIRAKNIAAPSYAQTHLTLQDESGTQISRIYYDGATLHQEIGTSIFAIDAGTNSFWKTGSGDTLWQGRVFFGQTTPADSFNQRLILGGTTYATAGTPLTTQYFDINTYAWNGSDGFTLGSTAQFRLTQLSAAADNARFDVYLGGSSRLYIDANGGVNMDFDGKTASDTSRITLPKDTKANLSALTRKEGTIVYASDEDRLYVDDGSNLLGVPTYYVEGIFTPIISTSGTNFSSVTYSVQTGNYTRIGRVVYFRLDVRWTNTTGSPTGQLRVGGLPFNAGAVYHCQVYAESIDLNAGAVEVVASTVGGQAYMGLATLHDAASSQSVDASLNAGATTRIVQITGFYHV